MEVQCVHFSKSFNFANGESDRFFGVMTAVFFIEVLPALNAQTLAIGFADRVDGHFQHGDIRAADSPRSSCASSGKSSADSVIGTLVEGVQLGE
jgi:hypothetical protein